MAGAGPGLALPGAGPRQRARAASVLRGLARFADARGIPADPVFLLDYDVIEAFCVAGLAGRASSTRGTYRSVLYWIAGQVHGDPGRRGMPLAGARAGAPYSPAERAALAAAARAQPTAARRAAAQLIIVFGIGAGLRQCELAALRGGDVTRGGGPTVVRVAGGPAPREVPVAAAWADRAAELARRAGEGFVFRPGRPGRAHKDFVNRFARAATAAPEGLWLSAGRCRSSFICDHLGAGTTLHQLLSITGIAEAGSLARYARHVPGMASSKAALRARWRAETAR